jgi:hypothetical protein
LWNLRKKDGSFDTRHDPFWEKKMFTLFLALNQLIGEVLMDFSARRHIFAHIIFSNIILLGVKVNEKLIVVTGYCSMPLSTGIWTSVSVPDSVGSGPFWSDPDDWD